MKETALALSLSGLGFILSVIWGGPMIRVLMHLKLGKVIRIEGPAAHMSKAGIPTMGGIVVIGVVALFTILLNAVSILGLNLIGRSVLLPLAVMISYGILGAIDDWEGIRGSRRGLGMRARTKFILQVGLAVIAAFILKNVLMVPNMYWPGLPITIDLGIWYIPIATFIIVATSNAVNFTDGLDGLAGLICATAFAAYGGIALMQGNIYVARFCFTVVGALFGFLWFNVHPAMIIMGDTGSLSLGALLGTIALMTGQWVLLPIIAIIPVSEAASVMLQVAYFKITRGKRLFKMAPLHHHFELLGWSETQIVQRFWLIGLLAAMIGMALAIG
ncbi:MAG: phospho-N-acetylmuramoyl-pentapeptide-transferase [Anaerolineaceae bacterium]|nr:phospho-N-acetylmuramoyl-pentapeptide-transferase [Anaerolineaceae bacterium]